MEEEEEEGKEAKEREEKNNTKIQRESIKTNRRINRSLLNLAVHQITLQISNAHV